MSTDLIVHTSTEIVPVNHKNLEMVPFESHQNVYKDKVEGLLKLSEGDRKAIKTEEELAKIFKITPQKIEQILEKDYPQLKAA